MLKAEGKNIFQSFLKISNLCTYLHFLKITQPSLSPHSLLLILPDPTLDLLMYLITTYMQIFYLFRHTIDTLVTDGLRVKISEAFWHEILSILKI